MGISYKRLREIITEEIIREHDRSVGLVFTRSGIELGGTVLYDINELREMNWHQKVALNLTYPIHVCAELQDRLLLPEAIQNLDHLSETVEQYAMSVISEVLIENLVEAADEDLITRIAEFVRTRAEADGSDLQSLPKADLMQIIVDASIDEGISDTDMPDIEDQVLSYLVDQGDVPTSYQEQ